MCRHIEQTISQPCLLLGLGRPHFHSLECTRIAAMAVEPSSIARGLAADCPRGMFQQLRDYCHYRFSTITLYFAVVSFVVYVLYFEGFFVLIVLSFKITNY